MATKSSASSLNLRSAKVKRKLPITAVGAPTSPPHEDLVRAGISLTPRFSEACIEQRRQETLSRVSLIGTTVALWGDVSALIRLIPPPPGLISLTPAYRWGGGRSRDGLRVEFLAPPQHLQNHLHS